MPTHSHLAAARDLVSRGFSVFPLRPNDKRPAIENWQNLATTDPRQIEAWWTDTPDANIGIPTSTLFVADVDPRNGGTETLKMLALAEDFPQSAGSITQGGGLHMIYRLPEHTVIKGGNGKLGKGIDVKSWGGYIVAPGSEIDGRPYRWANDFAPALPPQWMLDLCTAARPKGEKAGQRIVEEDDKGIELAQAWLARHAPDAAEGERDDAGFKVAAKFYDFGVSRQTAHELLAEWSDNHCFPPMHPDDVARLADSAGRNRSNAVGSAHPDAPGFEAVDIAPREAVAVIPTTGLLEPFLAAAAKAMSHAGQPLIKGVIDRHAMSILYGESNSGKTFVALDMAFCIAAGLAWAGRKTRKGAVVYVAAEGGAGIYKRLEALRREHPEAGDIPLYIVRLPVDLLHGRVHVDLLAKLCKEAAALAGLPVELIVVDTLSRALAGGDENSSTDMGALVKNFDGLRALTEAHLCVIHHSGKDKARGARGHSLLRAATDTEIEIDDNTITTTKQRDLDSNVALRFVLKPASIGTDAEGDRVVSCTIEIRHSGVPVGAAELTKLEMDMIEDIDAALANTTEKTFNWQFCRDSCRKNASDSVRQRSTIIDRLSDLSEKCWVKRVKPNQYVRVLSESVGDCRK